MCSSNLLRQYEINDLQNFESEIVRHVCIGYWYKVYSCLLHMLFIANTH